MEAAYKQVLHAFFNEDVIIHTMHTIIDHNRTLYADSITHVAVRCLNSAIAPLFVDETCSLFRTDRTIVMPYSLMSKKQLRALAELIRAAQNDNMLYQSEQRGGATSVSLALPVHCCTRVRTAHILAAMHVLLERGAADSDLLRAADIPGVVMQRLVASTTASATEIALARQLAKTWQA